MMSTSRFLAISILALSFSYPRSAVAHDYFIGELKVVHPFSRATPPSAKVGGGYLTIQNRGETPDRLLGATFDGSARADIHEMNVVDGVAWMRPLPNGVLIAPGATVQLKPGGTHLMLSDLVQPLKEGDRIKGVLLFEKVGALDIEFQVQGIASPTEAAEHREH